MAAYTLAALVALHKAALMDAAALFLEPADAAFVRHLQIAAREIAQRKRPRTLTAALQLSADVALYPAPADLLEVKVADWALCRRAEPWNYPRGPLPQLLLWQPAPDVPPMLRLAPAPTAAQIAAYGAQMPYYYLAAHAMPASGDTSITEREVNLLILRAKVEAMRELSVRASMQPTTLRMGQGMGDAVMSKNMTPPALYERFLAEYEAAT